MTREITEQMNSDMFDNTSSSSYRIHSFSEVELKQAKESFVYNGYKIFESDNILSVRKNG